MPLTCTECRGEFAIDTNNVFDYEDRNQEVVMKALNDQLCYRCAENRYYKEIGYKRRVCDVCEKEFWAHPRDDRETCTSCEAKERGFHRYH